MSGGSYNYAYRKIEEVGRWANTLESMADEAEEALARVKTKCIESRPGSHVLDKDVPITTEERAVLAAKITKLRAVAFRIRETYKALEGVEDILHDIEWAASGDYSWDQLMSSGNDP